MADSLFFDGIDDFITFDNGNFDGQMTTVGVTYAVVCKLVADEAAYKQFVGYNALDGVYGTDNASPHHTTFFGGAGTADNSSFTIPASDGWCIYAYTHDGTFAAGRHHKYVYSTDTWTHGAGSSAPNFPAACTSIHIAKSFASGSFMDANFLLAAVWDDDLGDAGLEALENETLQTWIDGAPTELWRFDTLSSISSLTGTSVETSRTGTTVDTGDVPAGWVDVAAGVTVAWLTA